MHEIITLQLGQQSNYLATHFWNTQESYFTYTSDQDSLVNHDIHFRPGIGVDGTETFQPRTVIYDLKGGFGTMKQINALYELQTEAAAPQALWSGPTVVQRQAVIGQASYQQSIEEGSEPPPLTKESVRYWSDFNRLYYHPKSIVQLNEYEIGSSNMAFEKWTLGEDLFSSLDKEHDILDRDLRPFTEEADHLQGIQMISSVDDAWGGFLARYVERLSDEYSKNIVWLWGLEDELRNTARDNKLLKLSNTARSITDILSEVSLFVPLTIPSTTLPPNITVDRGSLWHKSAVLATALESMTLPSRLKEHDDLLGSLEKIVAASNVNGNQKIAKLEMSVRTNPEQKQENGDERLGRLESLIHLRDSQIPPQRNWIRNSEDAHEASASPDVCLFPTHETNQNPEHHMRKKIHIFSQVENVRGKEHLLGSSTDEPSIDGSERARRAAGLPIIHRSKTPLSFPILDSFPHIYCRGQSALKSVSVRTLLSTDSSVALRIRNMAPTVNSSVGIVEREGIINSISDIADAYEEGWDSGSDEGDDD